MGEDIRVGTGRGAGIILHTNTNADKSRFGIGRCDKLRLVTRERYGGFGDITSVESKTRSCKGY